MSRMVKVYMIGAMKDGTAKSVSTFNLAYSLSKKGKRVLTVYFIPSSIGLSAVDVKLRLEMGTETILAGILDLMRQDYDFILLDTSLALNALNINAMAAADEVIVTVNPQLLTMKGLQDFLKAVLGIMRLLPC